MIDLEHARELARPDAVTWDGCDDAIVGVTVNTGRDGLYVYDYDLLIQAFIAQGMTPDEAMEWVDYNIVGAWVGDGTPIILTRNEI
jgi:hypothetical protein